MRDASGSISRSIESRSKPMVCSGAPKWLLLAAAGLNLAGAYLTPAPARLPGIRGPQGASSPSVPLLLRSPRPHRAGRAVPLRMQASDDDVAVADPKPRVSKYRLASGSSSNERLGDAVTEAIREANAKLPENAGPPSVLLLFLSSMYVSSPVDDTFDEVKEEVFDSLGQKLSAASYDQVLDVVTRLFSKRGWVDVPVVGCSVGGYLTEDGEEEEERGLSVVLGYLPGVKIFPFAVPDTFNESWKQKDWAEIGLEGFSPMAGGGGGGGEGSAIVLFSHPDERGRTRKVLDGLQFAFPCTKTIGGLAGRAEPTHNRGVFMLPSLKSAQSKERCLSANSVGLAMQGDIAIDAVVAQGARPIGPNFEIVETQEEGRLVTRMREIATGAQTEGPPMMLFDMVGFMGLIDMPDVQAALNYVALGVALNPLEENPEKMEYRVRPISDLEKDGPLLLADPVRPGQIVRFHVRDAGNATAELDGLMNRWRLEKISKGMGGLVAGGGLLMADQARGRKLFGKCGTEVGKFSDAFPGLSLGGGFFEGVIGELPNFRSRDAQEAPARPPTGNVTLPGISGVTLGGGVDTHTVASGYFVLYGPAEEE